MPSPHRRTTPGPGQGKGGGPKSPEGKSISARNSTKHGILSRDVVARDEQPAEFAALAAGLHSNFAPDGPMEEFFVDRLATFIWRTRRIVRAETALIDKTYAEVLALEAWGCRNGNFVRSAW